MPEKVQIILEIDDKGSARIKSFDKDVDQAFDHVKKSAKASAAGVERANSRMEKSTKRVSAAFGRMKTAIKGVGLVAAAAAAAVIYAGVRISMSSIDAASDIEEMKGKFDIVFAGMTKDAEKWADILTDSYLMSEREAKQYMSSIQDLLVPMGMAADKAGNLSFEITKLSADLGSFNNLPTEQVILDIQSALVGNYETMKKYGVVLNASTVQQKALDMGLAKTKDALTAAHKAHAAYTLIVQGSQAAIGDIARTSEGYANQMKQMHANIEDFQVMLGEKLLPAVTGIIIGTNNWYKKNKDIIDQKLHEYLLSIITALAGVAKTASYLPTIFAAIMSGLSKLTASTLALIQAPLKVYEKLAWLNAKTAIINRQAQKDAYEKIKATNAVIDDMGAGLIGAGDGFDEIGVKAAEFGLKAQNVVDNIEKKFKASMKNMKDTASAGAATASPSSGKIGGPAEAGTDGATALDAFYENYKKQTMSTQDYEIMMLDRKYGAWKAHYGHLAEFQESYEKELGDIYDKHEFRAAENQEGIETAAASSMTSMVDMSGKAATTMSDTFGTLFFDFMRSELDSLSDYAGSFAMGLQQQIASALGGYVTGWILPGSGGGVTAHDRGGWLTEPIVGVGMRTGQVHTFVEQGIPELVTPASQVANRGGNSYSISVPVNVGGSGDNRLASLIKSNVEQAVKDALREYS